MFSFSSCNHYTYGQMKGQLGEKKKEKKLFIILKEACEWNFNFAGNSPEKGGK